MNSTPLFSCKGFPFPMHSVLVWQRGKVLQEEYFAPFTSSSLHRMFSVTKSFAALSVCGLMAEGKVRPEDRIASFFPEYLPPDPHPYLTDMTVADMLSMRTCHAQTTYKADMTKDWTESFFRTAPDHRPGQIFKYDTSSAHTLSALVKKLSGTGMLDYLRSLYLDRLGFSREAHILKDPFGIEMGGSGLVASPRDLLAAARLLLSFYKGTWKEDFGEVLLTGKGARDEAFFDRYAGLVRTCMTFHASTLHEGKTLDECQGYGWQFWMVRGGIAMYGMGGQYVLFYPDLDLIVVTTADTQAVQGGTQYILDEAYRLSQSLRRTESLSSPPLLCPSVVGEVPSHEKSLREKLKKCAGAYKVLKEGAPFHALCISPEEISLEGTGCRFTFPLQGEWSRMVDPRYGQALYTYPCLLKDGNICLYVQILDDYTGSIRMVLSPQRDRLTLYLRKIEESLFSEFGGFLEARRI